MPKADDLLQTIESVHAAGFDETLWPAALASLTRLCGGVASTLEVLDKSTRQHVEFHAFGVPAPDELAYVDHYLALNPRVLHGLRTRAGDVAWDYKYFGDEAGIARDPFYAEFLPRIGFRYFVSGVLRQTHQEFAAIAVQRSQQQGHVGKREIALMRTLTPHVQQAFDVWRRLKGADRMSAHMGHALDWLADGAALVRADGTLLYVNESLKEIARDSDGIRIIKNQFDFPAAETATRFARALTAACGVKKGDLAAGSTDFPVPRAAGAPPYLVSLRPLAAEGNHGEASAIVFIHDPMLPRRAMAALLREAFGFTAAEADFALALQSGMSPAAYARQQRLSPNTVYTHLRRIKDKTGCKRQGELVRKLGEMQTSVRYDQ